MSRHTFAIAWTGVGDAAAAFGSGSCSTNATLAQADRQADAKKEAAAPPAGVAAPCANRSPPEARSAYIQF